MNHKSLEMQIQQHTQKDIADLKHDVGQLIQGLAVLDQNIRNSHISLVTDITKLTTRINFLVKIFMEKFPDDNIEEKFKSFAEEEQKKMQSQIADLIRKKEEENPDGEKNVQ
jgi:hypothetical protein